MAFIARKSFTFLGVRYTPGEVVKGFPEGSTRPDSLIHGGFVVEKKTTRKPQPVEVKPEPVEV